MAVSVRIPTILRTYTDDQSQVSAEGSTLSEVLDSLEADHPGIKARVVDEQGRALRQASFPRRRRASNRGRPAHGGPADETGHRQSAG